MTGPYSPLMVRQRPFRLLGERKAVVNQLDKVLIGHIPARGVGAARHSRGDPQIDCLRFMTTLERLVDQIARRRQVALVVEHRQVPDAGSVVAVALVAAQFQVGLSAFCQGFGPGRADRRDRHNPRRRRAELHRLAKFVLVDFLPVGFHGLDQLCAHALAVHLQYFLRQQRTLLRAQVLERPHRGAGHAAQ